jgi:hypothetical protein
VAVEHLVVDGDSAVERTLEVVEEDNSSVLEDEVVNRATITMMLVEVEAVLEVDDDSAGKTTTSRSATAMRRSISSLTGKCWRRLISTALLN